MKWTVTGAWKADGGEASMLVEAPNQRAAEAIAAQRGMVVEQSVPQPDAAQPVFVSEVKDPSVAFGLTRGLAIAAILCGVLLAPMLFGIPLLVWGIVAINAIGRQERAAGILPPAPPTSKPPLPQAPSKPVHYPGVKSMNFEDK